MSVWQAFVLGLVEGITEYLPVSSTGHLMLAQQWMGLRGEAAAAYAIVIQAGAILAVLSGYRERWALVLRGTAPGRALAIRLCVAFLPAGVVGLLLDDVVESLLTGLWPVVFAWALGGLLLLVWEGPATGSELAALTVRQAAWIGLAQCAALWPGTSRSLATIVGGQVVGLSRRAAVEFSFLLGLLTLGAATSWSAVKHGDVLLTAYGPGPILVGLLTSYVSAVVAIRALVGWVERHGLRLFAAWRLGIAAVVAVWLAG